LVLSLALLGFQHVELVSAVPEFSFSEIEAEIQVFSPVDNGSYTGNISLNISIRYYAFSHVPNSSVIPYQNINCLYQVDNSAWKSATLDFASKQEGFWSLVNDGYYNTMDCNYSALLRGLYNGAHSLNITLKPDIGYYYRVNNDTVNSASRFYVFGNYEQPTSTPQPTFLTSESFLGIVVVVALTITLLTILALRKIRKRQNLDKKEEIKFNLSLSQPS
jgi:hypothetical protein